MNKKTKLPKGLMLQEKAEELSYKVYDSDDIYPHVVTPSMGWSENTYEDGVDDYVDLRINAPDGNYQVSQSRSDFLPLLKFYSPTTYIYHSHRLSDPS